MNTHKLLLQKIMKTSAGYCHSVPQHDDHPLPSLEWASTDDVKQDKVMV